MMLDSSCKVYCVCERCTEGFYASVYDDTPKCPYCAGRALHKRDSILPGYVPVEQEVIEVSEEEHDALLWGARIESGLSNNGTPKPSTRVATPGSAKVPKPKGSLTRCLVRGVRFA